MPNPAAVVQARAYASLDPVPRGHEFQVAVQAEIAEGFHVNSHTPSDAYLIPTTLTATLPNGFQLVDTLYPQGKLVTFPFSPEKPLSVYAGKIILRLRISALAGAPLGPTTIPLTLRYQACNDSTCLPPVNIPVSVRFDVARAGTQPRASHPEIFNAPK